MPTTVRAKFVCQSITKTARHPTGFTWNYRFNVVYAGSEENKAFWEATPSGSIELNGIRDDLFEVGHEYYVDFITAE